MQNNRDLQTAIEVEHLYKLNYFSEEFILYSTAYIENGRIYYRFHEKSTPIYRFCNACAYNNILPLPPEEYVKMVKVETGMKEKERIHFANEIIIQMKKHYAIEIFQFQTIYQNTPFNDSAYTILLDWKKELMACFSIEQIRLFKGAVEFARGAKKLNTSSFQYFMHWIEEREMQIEETMDDNDYTTKCFSGFLYQENGKWNVFSNAVEEFVWKMRYQYQSKGIFCTPILQKNYCMACHPEWKPAQWKTLFEALLKEQMNSQFIYRINQLNSLPPVIDPIQIHKFMWNLKQQHKDSAFAVMRYYALLCNIEQ